MCAAVSAAWHIQPAIRYLVVATGVVLFHFDSVCMGAMCPPCAIACDVASRS